jgi:hypothetical protein
MRKLALAAAFALAFLLASGANAQDKQACTDAYQQGQSFRDQHKLVKAREQLRICAAAACPALIAKDCTDWLKDIEPRVPSVVLTAKNAAGADVTDVKVSVDGAPFVSKLDGIAVDVDPGAHTFVFEGEGGRTEQKVVVAEGTKAQRVPVTLGASGASTLVAVAPTGPAPAAAPASAEGIRLPVAYTQRGITNPAMILSPVAEFDVSRFVAAGGLGPSATDEVFGVGTGYSITDDFGVRVTLFALNFNPVQDNGLAFGATYRFLKGTLEMGVALDFDIQTIPNEGGVVIDPSVPMHLHLGDSARLDFTPGFGISTVAPSSVGFGVPVQLAIDIVEPFHIALNTGFGFLLSKPPAPETFGDTAFVSLGFNAGYAIAGPHGPIADINPFFVWPELVNGFGAQAGDFEAGVIGTFYIYL